MTGPDPSRTDALLRALGEQLSVRRASTRRPGSDPGLESGRDPFLRAAAVLHVFDPVVLRPFRQGTAPGEHASVASLFSASSPAIGWRTEGLRTLTPDVRQAAIRSLGSRDALRAALSANPDRRMTGVQRLVERWLDGNDLDLSRMTFTELQDLRQLLAWGLAPLGGLPPAESVERALAKRSTVAVFEHLVDRDFVGREAELDQLRRLLDPSSPGPRPLILWGPGGSGKTATVGRLLIERVEQSEGEWLPFAYLPFDSETLDVREPFTILLAVATQFSAQVDPAGAEGSAVAGEADRFRATVRRYRDRRGALRRRASEHSARGGRIRELSEAERGLYEAFVALCEAMTAEADRQNTVSTPVLLVFDTFEEVVYRAAEDLLGFWEMLAFLLDRLPQVRAVIAGRTRPAVPQDMGFEPFEIHLGELAPQDGVELLRRLGVAERATAETIAGQVGGNPLSLRLAARVAGSERSGPRGILGLSQDGSGAIGASPDAIGAELVCGQLYRRLLDHIHDEDARALAHPGMVLRRVTVPVIEEVLAPTCDLVGVTHQRALELFDELRREQSLVSVEGDGSLRYREEVRRPVLALLAQDKPAQVKRIHEFAVAFYRRRESPADRAEELYHRMALRQPAAELDGRWLPGVERYIASAVEELLPEPRRWLAGRMSIELPAEVYALADLGEWERLVGHKAMEVVRRGGPDQVLDLLAARADRTPESPLSAIEARALLDLGRPADAAARLDRAIESYPALGNPGRFAELLWLRAQATSAQGLEEQALGWLDRLVENATRLPSRLTLVQALTEILGLLHTDPSGAEDSRSGPVRSALAEALLGLSEAEVSAERSLVRLALVRLGPAYPALVARLAPLVVHDVSYLVRHRLIDVSPAVQAVVREIVREIPELQELARRPGDDSTSYVQELLGALVEELAARARRLSAGDEAMARLQPLSEALQALLRAEGTTLAGSSLAGIEDYREAWELLVTEEVAR